jgi:tricorn protease
MRFNAYAALAAAILLFSSAWAEVGKPGTVPGTKLLRFPNVLNDRIVFSYAGDLWTVGTQGGTATRLTSHPGLELFAKFSWTPDGKSVLFRSARDGYILTDAKLYTVPMNGGAAMPLPMPKSGAGSFSPDGTKIVYSPLWRDFRSEKRYAGGLANVLYIFDLANPSLQPITHDLRTDRDPMWIGDAIYLNSDRTGTFNLYRYDPGTRQIRQLTHYTDWDVRWPSADAQGQIVYESNGELHLYDSRSNQDRAVSIKVPADSTTTLPQAVNAAENIEGFSLSPGGERVGIVARGDVFSVPVEHGVTRNLTQSSSAHDREAAWSNDGTRLAYVSDRSGEEEIYVQAQDGNSPAVALTANSTGRYSAPVWSGDDKRIAFADNTNRLYVIDIASKKRTVVTQDPVGLSLDYRWSPDGRFLAYSRNDANNFLSVFVWSLADGQSHRITPQSFAAQSPAWSPNGELLYFLSQREYQPIISTVEFNFATDRQTGIFAVTLRKDVKNPFGIRDDEPGEDKDGEAEKDKPKDKVRDNKADKSKTKPKPDVKIEFDGIERRTVRIPLEADNIANLRVGDENLLYLRSGAFYYGREPGIKPTVMSYSIKEREAKPVADDVTEWSATSDGKHVLAEMSSKEFKYFEAGKSDDAKTVSLAGLATYRIPAAEWREIFTEVWRRYRDYFYVENMHGYDWAKLRGKYQPLLDDVGHRADLNYVISEMVAELTVQHAYIEGGDLGLPKRPFVALPGARFELDAKSGRYRIAKIFTGQNEEEHYRSPLTEVGVDVHAGDYVLSINGRELKSGTDPYELLQAPAAQPVEWRVAATADGAAARTVRYQPLRTEADLLYLDWVTQNRARVDALSHGRLGYIHLPDMGDAGIREFIKWWYPQVRKEGLVVDVRDNGGGNVSEMLIERLAGTLQETRFGRNHAATGTYPSVVQPGPKVALINEGTSSDGDIFSYQFRQWKIGRLIGKRTWGGVVGITDHGTLLDGGKVFVPEFGTADENGRWIIEGHGVDPDIVVDQDPVAVLNGHDPQLECGIQELLKLLPAVPGGLPHRPASPIKSEVH